jgi:type IV pilus assembly protein PilA
MRPRYSVRGLTLIELMIVVVIIGLMAAIALPQYQTYVSRSQVTRVMAEAGALKTSVESCVIDGRTNGVGSGSSQCDPGAGGSNLMVRPAANSAAPTVASLPNGTGVPEVTFSQNPSAVAAIKATFGGSAASILVGNTLTWTRDSEGNWVCATNADESFRPAACK